MHDEIYVMMILLSHHSFNHMICTNEKCLPICQLKTLSIQPVKLVTWHAMIHRWTTKYARVIYNSYDKHKYVVGKYI